MPNYRSSLMIFVVLSTIFSGSIAINTSQLENQLFIWPIDCVLDDTCDFLGLPDPDGDGVAYNGESPGYEGHEGTDISISWAQMTIGIDVFAAADGIVEFVFDGKYDRCQPASNHEDCQEPAEYNPGQQEGNTVCTELGPYCNAGDGSCFWCFAGGNVVVIKHPDQTNYFATRYDHFKTNSILVEVGQEVKQGDKIGEAGSAGRSTGPHLHFEVWGSGYYHPIDPWKEELWQDDPVDKFARDLANQDESTILDRIDSTLLINGLVIMIISIIGFKWWRKRQLNISS